MGPQRNPLSLHVPVDHLCIVVYVTGSLPTIKPSLKRQDLIRFKAGCGQCTSPFRAVSIVPEYMVWILATALAATLLYAYQKD